MQGFFQIATFHIPRIPEAGEMGDAALVDYIVISRRSRDRAGLRYQRRGVDDANVANFVETEAIMRVEVCTSYRLHTNHHFSYTPYLKREGSTNIFSYVQIRGSSKLQLSLCY